MSIPGDTSLCFLCYDFYVLCACLWRCGVVSRRRLPGRCAVVVALPWTPDLCQPLEDSVSTLYQTSSSQEIFTWIVFSMIFILFIRYIQFCQQYFQYTFDIFYFIFNFSILHFFIFLQRGIKMYLFT